MLLTCRDGIKALDCFGRVNQRKRKKKPAIDLKSAYYAKKRDRVAGNTMAKGMITNINQFREATGQEKNPLPDDGSICEIRAAVAATVLHVFPGETVAAMLDSANSSAAFIKRAGVTKTLAGSMQVPLRPSPGCGVQSVGVQSRAAAWCSCFFQVNKPKNPVIEIPTVKWKEGGLLVARPSRGLPPRDQLSIGN